VDWLSDSLGFLDCVSVSECSEYRPGERDE